MDYTFDDAIAEARAMAEDAGLDYYDEDIVNYYLENYVL